MKRLVLGGIVALAILFAAMGVLGAILHLLQQSLIATGMLVLGMLAVLSFWQDGDDDDKPQYQAALSGDQSGRAAFQDRPGFWENWCDLVCGFYPVPFAGRKG